MSYRDKLTGLYNRAYFDEKLEELNNEEFFPLSFVMGDLNGLKVINDAIGHLEGDKILKEISKVIKNFAEKMILYLDGEEMSFAFSCLRQQRKKQKKLYVIE